MSKPGCSKAEQGSYLHIPPGHVSRLSLKKKRLAYPAALTFFESHDCLERVLSVSAPVSSIPGTVSSKTGCRGREGSHSRETAGP